MEKHSLYDEALKFEALGKIALGEIFRTATTEVTAYRELLIANEVDPAQIELPEDISKLPILRKETYFRQFPLRDLIPPRALNSLRTFSATSGTSGSPTFVPRGAEQDKHYKEHARRFLVEQFGIDKKRTLGFIGFGMGIWIGGIFTYRTFSDLAEEEGYPLALVPTGPDIDLILKTIAAVGDTYEQILLVGYPPFIKDLIDEGIRRGVCWQGYHLRILAATESVTEEYRHYIIRTAHLKNPYADFLNIYGSVELGAMAYETPLSYMIRERLQEMPEKFTDIFPRTDRIPTIAQFDPRSHYFEEVDGRIYCSGYGSGVPLLRYDFPDRGGVFSFEELIERIKRNTGEDLLHSAKEIGVLSMIPPFPFVYVYEREGNMLVYSGANIYADEIRPVLYHNGIIPYVTGRFCMTKATKDGAPYFHIHVELRDGVTPPKAMHLEIADLIATTLKEANSEYAVVYKMSGGRAHPQVIFDAHASAPYFTRGAKQNWISTCKPNP